MSNPQKPIIYGSIKRGIVSSDLLEERAKKDFAGGFTHLYDQKHFQRLMDAVDFLESDPGLMNSHKFYEMTRQE